MDQAQSTVGSGGIWYELNKYGSPVPAYVNLEQNIYSETRPKSGIIQSLPEDFLFEVLEEATQKLLYFDPSTSVAFPDKPPNTLIIPAALSKVFCEHVLLVLCISVPILYLSGFSIFKVGI